MKLKFGIATGIAAVFMLLLATSAMAQGEPPAPYAGLKNPFPWGDSAAQSAGLSSYKQLCLGCHGIKGDNLPSPNFSKADFSKDLAAKPDYYLWVLSEGKMAGGMPAFKSALSEQQRWQVLTYLGSLSTASSAATSPAAQTPAVTVKGTLRLTAPEQAEAGKAVALTASFVDEQGKPVANLPVKFSLNVQLFTTGLMEIDQAATNEQGVAVFQYTPRQDGDLAAVVSYGASEARATVRVVNGVETTYQAEAGIQFPQLGGGIVYPTSVLDLGETSNAPMPGFRLPGGIFSWLLILVGTVFMIWSTYFRVMYQVFRIPVASEIRDINTRLIPIFGMIMLATIGVVLILKLLIAPYTHLHIPLS